MLDSRDMQTKDRIEYEVIMTTRLDIESKSNFTNFVAESFNWVRTLSRTKQTRLLVIFLPFL